MNTYVRFGKGMKCTIKEIVIRSQQIERSFFVLVSLLLGNPLISQRTQLDTSKGSSVLFVSKLVCQHTGTS